MLKILFLSEGNNIETSSVHRCFSVSEEINLRGYTSKVIPNEPILGKIPNFGKRLRNWHVVQKERPDIVILHRSSNIIDYYMLKKIKKHSKIIYDFDDALFHVRYPGKILSYSHIQNVIKKSDAIFAGSHYLLNYAKKFNDNAFLIPTPVNTNIFKPSGRGRFSGNKVVIGWLGAGTTYQLRYLKILKEPLSVLSRTYDIKFRIVSALSKEVRRYFSNVNFEVDFGLDHWVSIEKVPQMISDFDIGVMPLTDDPFSRGKCAMKALEYMAMEIPPVASAVGENTHVIENGYNGFLASSAEEWKIHLEELIVNESLRKKIGKNGRKTVEMKYSINAVVDKMMKIMGELQ